MRLNRISPYGPSTTLNEAAFTRQHYEKIAKLISTIRNEMRENVADQTLDEVSKGLASLFAEDNPRFDKGFFLNKCGV